jgi:hypothetical protein
MVQHFAAQEVLIMTGKEEKTRRERERKEGRQE